VRKVKRVNVHGRTFGKKGGLEARNRMLRAVRRVLPLLILRKLRKALKRGFFGISEYLKRFVELF
jgi:hypothetical protein